MPTAVSRLGALIQEVARERAHATPPPRGMPYLGLESPTGTSVHLLDALSASGVFRKYELVLDLAVDLGASARYLAARRGCEVVGLLATRGDADAAAVLERRARLGAHVRLVAGAPATPPFRAACFTHVWVVEALPRMDDPARALAAAARAVRPGGHLAVQDLVLRDPRAEVAIAGWHFASLGARVAAIEAAGFTGIRVRDVSVEAAERSPRVVAARDALLTRLRGEPALSPVAVERAALATALDGGTLGVVQLEARRP